MNETTADARVPFIFLARANAFVRQSRLKLALEDSANVVARRPDNAKAFRKALVQEIERLGAMMPVLK